MDIINFIKNNQQYFEDYITRSTYHSNAIEGNTLSFAETYAILFNDNDFKITAQPREFYEATNHKYAIKYVMDNIEEKLSEKFIKDVGVIINKNIMEISGYRTTAVLIRGAEHIPPTPNMLAQQMMHYVYNYNNTQYKSVFKKIAFNHILFERIHPLADGNGRTGRLIINYELLKNNIPPVVIPKEEKTKYFDMIASGESSALSEYLIELSEAEGERIKSFVL